MASVELQSHEPLGRGSQKQRPDWRHKYSGMKDFHRFYNLLIVALTDHHTTDCGHGVTAGIANRMRPVDRIRFLPQSVCVVRKRHFIPAGVTFGIEFGSKLGSASEITRKQ